MQDQSSTELTAWTEYLRIEDERLVNLIAYAIVKAFGGDKKQDDAKQQVEEDEEEEIIDTTSREFIENFKGFSYGNKAAQPPTAPPQRIQTGTQILFG